METNRMLTEMMLEMKTTVLLPKEFSVCCCKMYKRMDAFDRIEIVD